ncbi:MAG TPA: hypothetical protein EYN93_08510 [Planctomycetaceae bacterium]|nr:hypothetical protein [Planctomycetaceae bacterium]
MNLSIATRYFSRTIAIGLVVLLYSPVHCVAVEIDELTATIRNIGPKGEGHVAAQQAWKSLAAQPVSELVAVLDGFHGANQLATNWLRGAVDAIAQTALNESNSLPENELQAFVIEHDNAPLARLTAYEWLLRVNPKLKESLLPHFLNDSSLELRRDAVESLLQKAKLSASDSQPKTVIDAYRTALNHARDLDQIDEATKQITDLGGKVDLPRHFGFLLDWHVIAPFDNTNAKGLDVDYSPEQDANRLIDSDATHEGKIPNLKWKSTASEERFGIVDFNGIYPDKYKGAIAYAHTTFESSSAQNVQLRLGCINANKIWLNGKLLTRNNVYHANMMIDQYIVNAPLKKGTNRILLKIAQNEQEESWAQRWEFQLRVCDTNGTAVLAIDR